MTAKFILAKALVPLLTSNGKDNYTARVSVSGGDAVIELSEGAIKTVKTKELTAAGVDFGKSSGGTLNFNANGEMLGAVVDAPVKKTRPVVSGSANAKGLSQYLADRR
jgi:hypothetical protein